MSNILEERKKRFWEEFVAVYQNLPVLWNSDEPRYKCKDTRNEAYSLLGMKLKEIHKTVTNEMVVQTITKMHDNYRFDLKRAARYEKEGKPFVPKTRLFDRLNFLKPYTDITANSSVVKKQKTLTHKDPFEVRKFSQLRLNIFL